MKIWFIAKNSEIGHKGNLKGNSTKNKITTKMLQTGRDKKNTRLPRRSQKAQKEALFDNRQGSDSKKQ